MCRYVVMWKSFNTGEWYEKTRTDNKGAAVSTAQYSFGRAYKVIDTQDDSVVVEGEEDPELKEVNGYPEKLF